jgi:hypothetical protein
MGNWTAFGMLVFAFFLTAILWYRLGSSSEYRDNLFEKEAEEEPEIVSVDAGGVGDIEDKKVY